jgi:hypothetical protein
MRGNNPIISTAKVRGLIKKSGIDYVDATRALYGYSYARGINVWQLCDSIYLRPYGSEEQQNEYIAKLNVALAEFDLVVKGNSNSSTMQIVAVA